MNISPINGTKYYIGQRVIVDDEEIVTVAHAPKGSRQEIEIWVKFSDGVLQWRSPHNVKPLPNGEL